MKEALHLDKGKANESAVAQALAACGEPSATKALANLRKKYPHDTIIQGVVVPQGRAFLAFKDGDPHVAIELLKRLRAHDYVSFAPYLRGLAYLQLNNAQNAIASFRDVNQHRGIAFNTVTPYALAQLGLGRFYVLAGDKVNAKRAYEALFEEWMTADTNLPPLIETRKEYVQL